MTRSLFAVLALAAPALAGPKIDSHGDPLPDGAVFRFGTVRDYVGAPDEIYSPGPRRSFALSPDGKTLAAEVPGGITFWDVDTGTVTRRLPVRPPQVDHPRFGLTFSPDGKRLARMAGRMLAVWDLAPGKELFSIDYRREGRFETIAFAGGDRLRVTGLDQQRIWTIDAGTGKIVRTVELPDDYTAIIPAAPLLLGNGPRSNWTLIDPETGRARCHFPAVLSGLETIVLSPDGRRAWALATGGLLRAFEVDTGKELLENRDCPRGWGDWFAPLALSVDGAVVFAGLGPRTVQRWGVKEGKWLPPIKDVPPGELLPHPDGKRLLVLGTDGVVRRYDLATLQPLPGPDGFAGRVAAYPSPDGRRVLIESGRGPADGRLDLFELDGRRVWSARPGDAWGVPHWTPDGRRLVCVGARAITLRDAATGQPARALRAPGPDRAFAGLACVPPAGDRLIAPLQGGAELAVFDLGGEAGPTVIPTSARGATDVSPDGRRVAYAAKADGVRLFDPAARRFTTHWPNADHACEPAAGRPRFSPDGLYLLSWETRWVRTPTYGSRTGPVLRDAGSLEIRRELAPQPPAETAFSPDGLYLAIAQGGGKWALWDVPTGQRLGTWEGHRDEITSLGFAGPGRVVTGSRDLTALVWDLKPKEPPKGPPWEALAGSDADQAYRAVWALAADPKGPDLLRDKVTVVPASAAEKIRPWIADLGADRFAVRETATKGLRDLGRVAEAELRAARDRATSEEARTRLDGLLAKIPRERTPDERAHGRAVQALELAGTDAAKKLIAEWAAGAPGARLTIDAKAALARLAATR